MGVVMQPWTLKTDSGAPYLAPHPWDAVGKPPRPGGIYDPPADFDVALAMAEKLRSADADYEESESLKEQARDLERSADAMTAEAHALADKLNHPALQNAIEDDPSRFRHEDDVREWMEGR